jgi:hypothetical protein
MKMTKQPKGRHQLPIRSKPCERNGDYASWESELAHSSSNSTLVENSSLREPVDDCHSPASEHPLSEQCTIATVESLNIEGLDLVESLNIEGLDLACEFADNSNEDLPPNGSNDGHFLALLEGRTFDSLLQMRRRIARHRHEDTSPPSRGWKKQQHLRVAGIARSSERPRVTFPPRMEAVERVHEERQTIKKYNTPELIHHRNPSSVGVKDHNCDLSWRVRRLMRAKDSMELARERLPLLIVSGNDDFSQERLEDLVPSDDDISLGNDSDHDFSDEGYNEDSDWDPFEDEVDSIILTRKRLASRHPSNNQNHSQRDQRPFKDIHYGTMGLSKELIDSTSLNSGGVNCAA